MTEDELKALRESSGLSLDAEGNFFVHGEKVEHARSQLVLTQGMHRASDGRWATRIGREWGYVKVADVAHFVRRIEPVHDAATPGLLRATLTSGEEELIDGATFSSGLGDALYVTLKSGEKARLSRPAQLSLVPWMIEDEHGVALELDGELFPIGT
jgi:hypothetical protein